MWLNIYLYLPLIDIKNDGIESTEKSKKKQAKCFINLK